GTFNGPVLVSLQQTNPGTAIYFTLDGSAPDTNSTQYSAPFLLTNSAIVSANAYAPGYNNSVAASAFFTVLPGVMFTGQASLNNGVFNLQVAAPANKTYVLEGSTNLSAWVPVATNVPASSPFTLVDPQAASFRYRFYRAVQLP
ncbi:MAG TPA: chitobiase/beta-hexosaminidase C-terminal domain-containing protein, partial [Verrucomicrobiae bacterium]|nr:chitobiase/beta-hexosaminidase C-terminal domain-containing protein [Verrucomicrobiae bacterium]